MSHLIPISRIRVRKVREVVKRHWTLEDLGTCLTGIAIAGAGIAYSASFLKAIHVVPPGGTSVFSSLSDAMSALQTQGLIAASVTAPAGLLVAAIAHHFTENQRGVHHFKKLAITLAVLFLVVPNFAA